MGIRLPRDSAVVIKSVVGVNPSYHDAQGSERNLLPSTRLGLHGTRWSYLVLEGCPKGKFWKSKEVAFRRDKWCHACTELKTAAPL